MFKKVLMPLDGSDVAEQALTYLDHIAVTEKETTIVLLNVVEPVLRIAKDYTMAEETQKEESKREKQARKYLNNTANKILKEGKVGKVQTIIDVSWGDAAEEILNYAEAENVDSIIMTTYGQSASSRWRLGSVTNRIVSHSKVPVLTVPPIV